MCQVPVWVNKLILFFENLPCSLQTTWTSVKIPGKGTVYDYFVNPKTQKFQPWAELVTDIDYDGTKPM